MSKKIKWGFIGCGNVVETKSGPAFNYDKSEIYAIMRRNIEKAKESANKLGAKKYYDNVDELLQDKEIDAVYIATPPGLHYEQAKKCCMARENYLFRKTICKKFC